jgi:imidazolonepropionase-like amidohydrolase
VNNHVPLRRIPFQLIGMRVAELQIGERLPGLTPSEVITAATRNSAQILGLDQLGMVAPGKNADFLVLDADPLDNIANTRRISRVYLQGAEVDRAALKKQLNGGSAGTVH